MPRKRMDFDSVRSMALGIPGVEESTAWGSPAFKVQGKLLACVAMHKSAEPGSLMVCVELASRAELLATAPDVYYLTPHYVKHPVVLVRMSRIHPDAMRDLLLMACRLVTAKRRRGAAT